MTDDETVARDFFQASRRLREEEARSEDPSLNLVVPGSGVGSGLDQVRQWPTHEEYSRALRRLHEAESRVSDTRNELEKLRSSAGG